MDLNIIWFILIAILFMGFFFLEGFDFGVGILLMIIGKNDTEKRVIINTIGPFWDANEVWLITAGGAIFAAFPNWYATMFSGFYLALLLILIALIFRGVAFEFRSKRENLTWRNRWDLVIFTSSFLLSLLWGVALSNLIKGVPIDSSMNFVGSFWSLISPYTIIAGLTTLFIFLLNGSIFLSLKADLTIKNRAIKISKPIGLIATFFSFILIILSYLQTDLFKNSIAFILAILAIFLLVLAQYFMKISNLKLAMISNALNISLGVSSLFAGLFPRVMVSTINPNFSLTIFNSSSSLNTLSLMTKVAFIFVPIVLAYQVWSYWVFRKRVSKEELEY